MPFIVKTAPFKTEEGLASTICERPMYGGANIQRGDEAFIWLSETQGGSGLSSSGIVEKVGPERGRKCVTVNISKKVSSRVFTIADLEPFRNVNDGSPISGLARKLYKHAHNKIAELSTEEADFLRKHFD